MSAEQSIALARPDHQTDLPDLQATLPAQLPLSSGHLCEKASPVISGKFSPSLRTFGRLCRKAALSLLAGLALVTSGCGDPAPAAGSSAAPRASSSTASNSAPGTASNPTPGAAAGSAAQKTQPQQKTTAPAEEPVRLVVFAAASLTETLNSIGDSFQKENPAIKVVYSFDSSGTLKTQIAEGAVCDVFISAAPKQMDQLDITSGTQKNPQSLDYVDSTTRFNLLENKVALVVPKNNRKNIQSFDDLISALKGHAILLGIGNSDVPVGQYTLKIFDYYHLDVNDLYAGRTLTLGSNVKEVTSQVSEGVVDAGIVYATDARSAGLTVVATATPEMAGQVIYPAAALKGSEHPQEARRFLAYLKTPEAGRIFESVGFTVIGD